ncbi:hypothetical protein [Acidithiobacillus sp.]
MKIVIIAKQPRRAKQFPATCRPNPMHDRTEILPKPPAFIIGPLAAPLHDNGAKNKLYFRKLSIGCSEKPVLPAPA